MEGTVRSESWRLLGRLLSTNRRTLAVAALAGIGWQLAGLVVPVIVGWTVERGIEDGVRSAVWLGAAGLLALGAVEAACAALRHWMACTAYMDTSAQLRVALTEAALGLDDDASDRFSAGEIVARETSDTDTVGGLFDSFGHTVAQLVSTPVILVILALIDPILAVAVGVIVPLSVVVTWRYSVVWERRSALAQASMGTTVEYAQEVVEAGKVIRGIGAQMTTTEQFAVRSAELRRHSTSLANLWVIFEPLLEALSVLPVGVVLWVGGTRVINGDAPLGGIVTAVGLVLFLSGPVRTVGQRILTLQASLASADRVVEVLRAATPRDTDGGSAGVADAAIPGPQLDVRAEGLVVGKRASDGIELVRGDMRVRAGELAVLSGRTGSGKSTLLAVVAGLRQPLGGELMLDGRPYRDWPSSALRRRLVLCGPTPFLFAGSLRENVRFAAPDADEQRVRQALDLAQCDFVAELPDEIDTVIGERGVTLSGGQRQRLAIARAVVARPSVLLLDSATSALDAETEERLVDALRASLADTAIVIVSDNARVASSASLHIEIDAGQLAMVTS